MNKATAQEVGYTILDITRWDDNAVQCFKECYNFISTHSAVETIAAKFPWLESLVYCFEDVITKNNYTEVKIKQDRIWFWEGTSPEYGAPAWVEGLVTEVMSHLCIGWKPYAVLSYKTVTSNEFGCKYFADSKVVYIMPHVFKEFTTEPKKDISAILGAKEALKTWQHLPITSKYRTSCANMFTLLDAAIRKFPDETLLRKLLIPQTVRLLQAPGKINWEEYNILAKFYRTLEKCEYPHVPKFKELGVEEFNKIKTTCTQQKKKLLTTTL